MEENYHSVTDVDPWVTKPETRDQHGMTNTPEHVAWRQARANCNVPKERDERKWKSYAGKGIKVDKRWDSFMQFYRDMGPKPGKDYNLARINTDLNYGPENCVWMENKSFLEKNGVNFRAAAGKSDKKMVWPDRYICGHPRTTENSNVTLRRKYTILTCKTCAIVPSKVYLKDKEEAT